MYRIFRLFFLRTLRRTYFTGETPADRYTGRDILHALLLLALLLTIFSISHSLETI